jgi:branched-chain amino acid transport system substrate-binding protein
MKYLLLLVLTVLTIGNALADDTIKIGLLASMSDEWASLGKNSLRGAEIAVSEINSSGGVNGRRIQLEVEDTLEANSGARALSAYQSLRQRGIRLFIGPSGTPAGMSLAPIIASQKVVIITPSVGVRDFSDAGSNIFNSRGVDEQGSAATAQLAVHRGWKRAAILSSQQPWEQAQGEAFRREFERLGGTIVGHAAPLPETNDFRTIIAKILSGKPQVVFLSNSNRMAVAAKQLAELRFTGPKLTTILDNFPSLQPGYSTQLPLAAAGLQYPAPRKRKPNAASSSEARLL